MTKVQKAAKKVSEARSALLAAQRAETPEQAAIDAAADAVEAAEVEYREALDAEAQTTPTETLDAETRERISLRDQSRYGRFLHAAIRGVHVDGREAELLAAVGGAPGTIPLDCGPPLEMRADAATTVPAAGTGVNVAPISPYVFSESIAPMLGIDMPSAPSGSYSEPVITTALTAGVQPKGGTQESTAATIANRTAAPRRITGRLTLQLEDLAAFGNETYESALRQNLAAVLSDQYDRQAINGDGTGNNVNGLIAQLADPDDPTDVSDFDAFVAAVAGGVDGLWAKRLADVFMLVNPDTYRVAARSFRDRVIDSTAEKEVRAAASLGDVSVADYLEEKAAGFRTNARMPATSSDIARAIIYKMGRPAMRTACHPTWGTMQIEDIYTDSGAGQIHVTLHALVGSAVLLIQSAAYSLVEFKTA